MWEVICAKEISPTRTRNFFNLWKPEYYLERYGDKETFIRRESSVQHVCLHHGGG